jgi:hypothetical protein
MNAGSGLIYQGVPMVRTPTTGVVVQSGDPACTMQDGNKLIPQAAPPAREWLVFYAHRV